MKLDFNAPLSLSEHRITTCCPTAAYVKAFMKPPQALPVGVIPVGRGAVTNVLPLSTSIYFLFVGSVGVK